MGHPVSDSEGCRLKCGDLDRLYVGCRFALWPVLNIKADGLTFLQAFETAILDSTEMHEHVGSVFSLDKAEALAFIEPLNFSLHSRFNHPFMNFRKSDYRDGNKKTTAL